MVSNQEPFVIKSGARYAVIYYINARSFQFAFLHVFSWHALGWFASHLVSKCLENEIQLPYARHYNPLLIWNRSQLYPRILDPRISLFST